jgi:hypothetical protein
MEQIQPAYATFEQGKKLKEKGFNVKVISFFDNNILSELTIYNPINWNSIRPHYYSRPEQWQIVEWLRVNHGIWISIQIGHDKNKVWYNVYLEKIELTHEFEPINNDFDIGGDTPQEAYSAAFDHILNELI